MASEHQCGKMELADRKSLLRILAFLDGKLPLRSSISVVSVVKAALLTESLRFRVYFQQSPSCQDEFAVIVCVKHDRLAESNRINAKLWIITAWSLDDTKLLGPALSSLKEIKWNEDFVVLAGSDNKPDNHLQLFIAERGLDINTLVVSSVDQYYMPLQQALSLQLCMPDDVYVKSLEPCHADIVYEHWPVRKMSLVKLIAEEIDALPSAGVFLKATNELVSWITFHPNNGMSRLHTLEMYRGKGYASLVVRYVAKRLAQAGIVPTANVGLGNQASQRVFESLGFQRLQPWHIIFAEHETT